MKKIELSANQLKIIAVTAMIIDHIGWGFVDDYSILGQLMHIIGRLTIPIMCFFVAEGFVHTSNLKKYVGRMAIFAAISYVPYVLYLKHGWFRFDFIFDLLLALLFLTVWEKTKWNKAIKIIATIALAAMSLGLSGWPILPTIYVAVFYYNRDCRKKQMKWFAFVAVTFTALSTISLFTSYGWLGDATMPVWGKLYFLGSLLAIPLLYRYNGTLGNSKQMKWLFYVAYPGHLFVLYMIQVLNSYQIFLFISVFVTILMIIMIIRCLMEPPSKAQTYFILSSIGVTIFVIGVMLEVFMSHTLEGAEVCLKIQYTGQIVLFISYILFIANFANIKIPNILYIVQVVLGTVDIVACYTMEFHHLFYKDAYISYDGEYPMIDITAGLFYIIHYVDMAIVFIGILVICTMKYIKGSQLDKKRIRYIFAGLSIVIIELILKVFGVFGTYNPISFALFIMMSFLFIAFFRFGYFDTVQVATSNVLNQGNEGLIVVDDNYQILSVNKIIEKLYPSMKIGTKISGYETLASCIGVEKTQITINNSIYEVRYEKILNKQGYPEGFMLWFVDMTEHLKYLQTLQNYKTELELEVKKQADALKEQHEKIINLQKDVIISIADIIESRDGTTGEHVKRTSDYVNLLIKQMKKEHVYEEYLTDDYIENICNAAPMHDIGKIAIPDSILKKPDRLETEEIQIMNTHTSEGGKIISRTMVGIENNDYVRIASNVANYHHEKWNGMGYPSGIKQEEIPLEARIMAIADVFDALTAERPYKKAMSLEKTYEIMEAGIGTQFDPEIMKVFMNAKKEFEELLYSYQNEKKIIK